VTDILQAEGIGGLERLPTIGESIARSIRALLTTGRLPLLERLRGESDPEGLLMTIPGIGQKTAALLHELGIDSLEDLELAAFDGRLQDLAGIGEKRLEAIRDALMIRLGRMQRRRAATDSEPSVAELLEVDREYRDLAKAGKLRLITPRRFNPEAKAWLPVMHTQRGTRHYTVLYSNTARAHELGMTHDWVVLYCDTGFGERQFTAITSQYGGLQGKRIIRGREAECKRYYWPDAA
jgi:hypothetical protein